MVLACVLVRVIDYRISRLVTVWFTLLKSLMVVFIFFFQAEDGIRDLVRSRGLGDVYKRQIQTSPTLQNLNKELHWT